jgi:predicted site-specific integrase-resolvase
MTRFANATGLSVVAVIKEVAFAVNGTRPKLTALLKEDSWVTLVVEHKDRLSRVGFGWFLWLARLVTGCGSDDHRPPSQHTRQLRQG